jgi:hypothetical protein
MKKIILIHLLIWLILSVGFFFLAEPLVKLLFPGFHDVGIWLITEFIGLLAILLIMTTSLIINVVRHQRHSNASS